VTSTQLDSNEAIGLLRGAGELGTTLLDAATGQKALSSKEALQAQVEMIEQVDPKQKGKFAGGVGGQDALKAAAGSRDADADAAVEKFGAPLVLMEAPSSINWATSASTVVFAGGQLQWTTQADLHMAAAYTIASVSANATGLFTHDGGIQAVAANGPVSLQAHTDQLEILADKAVTIVSVNDVIEIKAKEKIVLQAGQSSVTLEGGNITFACPGNFSVKGGQHTFTEGESNAVLPNPLPDTRVKLFDEAFILKDENSGIALAGFAYRIIREDGTVERGVTDHLGKTHLVGTAATEPLQIEADEQEEDETFVSTLSNPVCWIEDYETEISAQSYGRYYIASNLQGGKKGYQHKISSRYKLYIPARSGTDLIVEVRCAAEHVDSKSGKTTSEKNAKLTYSESRLESAKAEFVKAVEMTWNHQFSMLISDPECGVKKIPIKYRIIWVDPEQKNDEIHYTVYFHDSEIHEHVGQNYVDLNYSTTKETFAHEFIHLLGVPDEYGKPKGSASLVQYYQPDGKLAPNMVVFSKGFKKQENDERWNIMSSNDSLKTEIRHAWNIAIETQGLLTNKTGRQIECSIVRQ
jgi:type VI secretion system secreted protein VgrG